MTTKTIASKIPHHRLISKDIAQRLGYKVKALELPASSKAGDSAPDNSTSDVTDVNDVSDVSDVSDVTDVTDITPAYVLLGPDNKVCYRGQKLIPSKDQVFEIQVCASEAEAWNRDTPDYFHDLGISFSLLKNIPYHSIRLMALDLGNGPEDVWEISYRLKVDGATYIEQGPFLTILIANIFLECTPEISENDEAISDEIPIEV